MKEMVRYGLILGLICFVASAVLAVVNSATEPKIKLQKNKEENAALREVMPQASDFKPHYQDDKIIYYSAYDSRNKLSGFVIRSEGKGYSSNIEAVSGLSLNLEITDVKILSQNETPGLGSRVSEPSFLERFRGKNLDTFNQVQAITGATISSSALISSIKDKIAQLQPQLLKEIGDAK